MPLYQQALSKINLAMNTVNFCFVIFKLVVYPFHEYDCHSLRDMVRRHFIKMMSEDIGFSLIPVCLKSEILDTRSDRKMIYGGPLKFPLSSAGRFVM